MNYGKLCSLSIKSSIMRISGSLTFLDASVGGYNLQNNDRMNIVESAKQTTCSTAEILNIKCGSAARVERATCIARTAQVLCIEGLDWSHSLKDWLPLPSGMQFTSTFENAQASLQTRVH